MGITNNFAALSPDKKSMTMKIAYVVYRPADAPPGFVPDEHTLLLQFLQQKELDITEVAWAGEGVQWEDFDCVVLKSPWDYVWQEQEFYAWMNKVTSMNITLLNPAHIVQWNCDKHYLQDIAAAGMNVLPTVFLEKNAVFEPAVHFKNFHTDQLIVKPCVSGASRHTFKLRLNDAHLTPVINELLQSEAMMVQPFMPEVMNEGEWSLLYFNGRFSHSLLKTPVGNDFRSQPQFGAAVQGKLPPDSVLAEAAGYVDVFAKGCLYARVDGLIINGSFYLMELELADPVLFLDTYSGGYENYYKALSALLPVERKQS